MLTRNKRRIDDYLAIEGKGFKIDLIYSFLISNIDRLTGNEHIPSINESLSGETTDQQIPVKKRRLSTKIPRLLQSAFIAIRTWMAR